MRAVKRQTIGVGEASRGGGDPAYAKQLTLYRRPPSEDITLEEFQRFGQERLSLLQDIAAAKATGKTGEAYHNSVKASVEKWMPLRHGNVEDVRKDVVSHFVLRLAFCAAQNRPWFITQEVLLLEHRLTAMGAKIPDFFADNALDYKPISEELFEQLEEALKTVYYDCAPHNAANYYPVPFQEATQLLKGRRAFLVGGQAIVHAQKLVQIVSVHFKLELSRALATTAKAHHSFGQDERIAPLLGMWSNGYLSGTGTAFGAAGAIDLGKIDQIADAHYPLCMKHTHRSLRANHHLMHNGRMQYGLFLKGIGVTLDDSVNFWRSEFTKRPDIDEKVFNSRYAYNIRHNYGKEGKRMNYSAYGCPKVINTIPSANETCGCPFRSSKADELMQDFQGAGIGPVGAAELIKLVEGMHFQIACKKYFDLTHPANKWDDTGVTHPNTYFKQSQVYWDERKPKEEKVKDEKSSQSQQPAAAIATAAVATAAAPSASKSSQLAE